MNINDETLSAFLDSELSEKEMEAVRARIAEDENLANRLAELASVDSQIKACYETIDTQPIPTAITDMIAASAKQQRAQEAEAAEKSSAKTSAKIFRFPRFEPQHLAMAASVALAIGIGMSHWLKVEPNHASDWQQVAHALDTLPSGQSLQLNNGDDLTAKVSFNNRSGQVCRQYQATNAATITQGIACHSNNTWQSVAALSLANNGAATGQQYQTASNDKAIVELIDSMAVGSFLNRSQEADAIANGWATNNHTQATDK